MIITGHILVFRSAGLSKCINFIWLLLKTMGCHFGVGAPPILEPILVGIGMFTGNTIWICPMTILWMDEIMHHFKPWEATVCWHLQGNHHSMVSQVMQDFVHPQYEFIEFV